MNKYIVVGIVVAALLAFEYMRESTRKGTVPDASQQAISTANGDNSVLAQMQAQAYYGTQPKSTPVPTTPYGWSVFQGVNRGGNYQ